MRKIAVFTATRAEYGLLRPLLLALRVQQNCQLQLVVSGTHLSATHGHTLDAIIQDGFVPVASVPIYDDAAPQALHTILGKAVASYGDALARLAPDIVVINGDRHEALCMALAATTLHIPLAHISGGETTQGSMDEVFRHAITKMAHLHFSSCEVHRRRIVQLGEQPDRVWNVGSLGVECLHYLPLLPEAAIRADLGIGDAPYILCTLHPDSLHPDRARQDIVTLCAALETQLDYTLVFTGANADEGGQEINAYLRDYVAARPQHRFYMSLGQVRYFSTVACASCVLGNSSSGIIEVPSFGVPVINVGERQKGREHAPSVLHCPLEKEAIALTLSTALHPRHRLLASMTENIYPSRETSQEISVILTTFSLNYEDNVPKVFYDFK